MLGKQYFETDMGKAIFVRRASVGAVGNKAMIEFIAEIKENKENESEESDSDGSMSGLEQAVSDDEGEESDSDGSMSGLQHMDVGDYV